MAEHYAFRASVRLSKNYNSIEVSAEYGRDVQPKEKLANAVVEIQGIVWDKLSYEVKHADELLSSMKKG